MQEKTTFDYVLSAIAHYRTKLRTTGRDVYGEECPDREVLRNSRGDDMGIHFQTDPIRKTAFVDIDGFIDGVLAKDFVGLEIFVNAVHFGVASNFTRIGCEAMSLQNASERQQLIFALTEMNALSNQIEEIFRNTKPEV